MRRVLNTAVTTLSIICAIVTIVLIIFADVILKDNNVYTLITTTTESINIVFETDPLVLDGTDLSLMQGVTATSESGDDVTALVDAMVVNENNKKVVMYSVNDSRYSLETFKRGLELRNYKGPSISIRTLDEDSNYTCDINEIENYIFTMMDAGYITADDGYGNDISQNVYISPDVNITEAGKQNIKLLVKNSFADFAEKEITIKITGELARDEIIVATETVTAKRDNTYSSNRESSTAVNVEEEGTFNTAVNSQLIGTQATEAPTKATAPVQGILRPHIPMYPVRPLIPVEPIKPIVPIVPPEATVPTVPTAPTVPTEEVPTEEIPTEEVPTGEAPTEEIPTEEVPTSEVPTGETPTEEIPTEEIPTEEIPTELPPELATAVIYFADDNEREPITVNVGDTFTYDVYLKLSDPEVQSFALWTYFNQPVGTKQTPNQAGSVTVTKENQVLKIADDGYTPYYSPFREKYDLMKSDSYLIGFATGALNENDEYMMIETENGEFTKQGGCMISTVTFKVEKPGEVEIFTRIDDAVIDLENSEKRAEYVAIYNQEVIDDTSTVTPTIPEEEPSEDATAIIHFVDDNKREPITAKIGDTFTYDIRLKLTAPEVQSYATWTYFNQPVGTKKSDNQIGNSEIPKENQVLKVVNDGYIPYYSPFDPKYDFRRFSNYLIAFGTGLKEESGKYQMLKTDNGSFTQEGGCLVSTITFKVQRPGEVEVFTRLDNAVVDHSTGQKAEYVAVYNSIENLDDNRNPEITSVDLTQMKKAMLDSKPMEKNEFVKKGYDVNNDGKYTLADIIMMNRNIFKTKAS
ncbi:MAG: dockerin type I domain-containing protein [Acutalibacteraceae bacterium]|nr:dockerin type I domain-containing protein [Acutalibacteraceae bacterium]